MKRLLLGIWLLVLLGVTGSRAQDDNPLENMIWAADAQVAATLVLEHIRRFDPAFQNAFVRPLDRQTTEIVIRSTPLQDLDGNLYLLSIFVSAEPNSVVLTFLNLEGDLPDLNAPLLTSRLFKSILQLMDANYKRVPAT